jgi:glycosyltransferase involved in cell wall biosynthesis
VVLPSEWYENAPVSVLEAYALGKPVLGARIGGIPELIRDHETGICFESGNIQSLVEALQSSGAAPDAQLEQMGRAARRWVEQDFTVAKYRQRILAAYGDLGVRVSEPQALPLRVQS